MKNTKKLFSIAFGSLFREKFLVQKKDAADIMAQGKANKEAKEGKDTQAAKAEVTAKQVEKTKEKSATLRAGTSARGAIKVETDQHVKDFEDLRRGELDTNMQGLNAWKMNIIRRSKSMNADKWDPSTEEGWAVVKKDWITLGLWTPPNNPFYLKIEEQMKRCHEAKKNTGTTDKVSMMLRNPHLKTQNQIAGIDSTFAEAYGYFRDVKGLVTQQTTLQTAGEKARQDKNSEPFLEEAGRIVKSNINEFKNAIKRRDYATAGLYVVGIWAAWNAVSGLPDDETSFFSKSKMKKWFFWGATAYAGAYMAKKAGYDIMEKLGFKESWESVKGTPIEYFKHFYIPGKKPVDLTVTQALSKTNIGSISKEFYSTNGAVPEWIDPNQFSGAFADKNFGGLRANDLKKTTPLSTEEAEYLRVGQEIYASYQVLQYAYDKTMKDHSGMSFEEAISRDPVLQNSTVEDFASALFDYVPEDLGDNVLETGAGEKLREKMYPLFENSDMGLDITTTELETGMGVFAARMMDYPVVIRINSKTKSYDIFRRNTYEELRHVPTSRARIASVPMEGEADGALTILEDKITDIMKANMALFIVDHEMEGVRYEEGKWRVKITEKNHPHLPEADLTPVDATVRMGNLGRSMSIYKPDGGILLHMKDVANMDEVHGSTVLARFSRQTASDGFPDLSLFQYFNTAGMLSYVPGANKSKDFSIRISNMSGDIKFEYDEKARKYKFKHPEREEELLKDHKFTRHLQDAMRQNSQLENLRRDFTSLVKNTPESYFEHFLKSVPNWFTDFTIYYPARGIKLENFTGSVPKNYFLGLLEAKFNYLGAKAAGSLKGATTFDQVAGDVTGDYQAGIKQLNDLHTNFANLHVSNAEKGQEFTAAQFDEKILSGLVSVGIKSKDYNDWYRSFVDQMYLGYGKDDLREQNAIDANRAIEVFAWHTRVIDNQDLDGVSTFFPYANPDFMDTMHEVKTAIKGIEKSGGKATDAEITARVPSLKSPKQAYTIKDYKEALRGVEQIKRKEYANHVAGQIKRKLPTFTMLPHPGADAWGITPYESFESTPYPTTPEVVAGTAERMKMSTDKDYYIPFDEYLLNKAKYAKLPKDELKKKLILPLHDCPLTLSEDDYVLLSEIGDYETYTKRMELENSRITDPLMKHKDITPYLDYETNKPITEPSNIPQPHIPELNNYTQGVLQNALIEVERKVGGTPTEAWKAVKSQYAMPTFEMTHVQTIQLPLDPITSTRKRAHVYDFSVKSSSFPLFASQITTTLNSMSKGGKKEVPRAEQERVVHEAVVKLIKEQLSHKAKISEYFNVKRWATKEWEDFTMWLSNMYRKIW